MAAFDHSTTYRNFKLRNIPHFFRLRKIVSILKDENLFGSKYIDIGCSNGYITNIIGNEFKFKEVSGADHTTENLNNGKLKYPDISFEFIDLNKINFPIEQYNLVTCLETIEHVGNMENAISTLINHADKKNSIIFISVPIEIGFWGISKFLIKSVLFNYKLNELYSNPSRWEYFQDLIRGNNISKYRNNRLGWGTHFGFNYKEVDKILNSKNISFKAYNRFTTRFYIIRNK